MAAAYFNVTSGAEGLAAATEETILMVTAASNQLVRILGYRISFDGATASATPVVVTIFKASSAGTSSAATPVLTKPISGYTIQATAARDFTAEPTVGSTLDVFYLTPYNGFYDVKFDSESEIILDSAERFAIKMNAPATVNTHVTIFAEE